MPQNSYAIRFCKQRKKGFANSLNRIKSKKNALIGRFFACKEFISCVAYRLNTIQIVKKNKFFFILEFSPTICYNFLPSLQRSIKVYDVDNPATLDSKIQKLIVLFVFEKMAIPLEESTVLDLCTSDNNWLSYIDCKQYLDELLETNLLYRVPRSDYISITQDGISCLSLFFPRIPSHIREEITNYTRENRMRYKRKQQYFCDYSKNSDGTYTVIMKIKNDITTLMELRLIVNDRQTAKYIFKNWTEKASETFALIHDTLLE